MESNRKYSSFHQSNIGLYKSLLLICSIAIILTSCKKKDTDETPPVSASDKGMLILHLHTYLENEEIQFYNIAYPMTTGREISLSLAQLYITDIQVVKLDGSTYDIPGKKLLQVRENDKYDVGEIPVGNYNTIRFKVGFDATTNALEPSSSPDSAILKRPEMWLGGTPQPDGYAFIHLKGQIDTSAGLSGLFAPFEYKIGTNANYRQVTVTGLNLTVVKNQGAIAHMYTDYYKLLDGVLVDQNGALINQSGNFSIMTAADNSSALATTMANNISQMFRPE